MRTIVLVIMTVLIMMSCQQGTPNQKGEKIIVLSFDDAVKSHLTFVAPLLKELDFGATFFITQRWMEDSTNFLTWEEVGQLHKMGFEIGNHSWSHLDFSLPENAARLAGELGLINRQLELQDIPIPVSFAYSGNFFGPEAVKTLEALGYKYARRGMQPEIPYGKMEPGPLFDPKKHHPLLIPSAGDAYPNWNLEYFKKVVDSAGNGQIAVLQFHGIPDIAHDWVTTDPELFKQCMQYLKDNEFRVIAVKDLEGLLPENIAPDTMLSYRHSSKQEIKKLYPPEAVATREHLPYWLANMLIDHNYSIEEAGLVTQLPQEQLIALKDSLFSIETRPGGDRIKIRPYPGGRHPRIGFLDGALDPLRGTKFSVFLPWNTKQYVVVDLPEAVFSNLGLTFLAHRHIPTIWDYQHQFIDNVDWQVNEDGSLENTWKLPNGISIGARAIPLEKEVKMDLWLFNGTDQALDSLKTQVCVMLKGSDDFNQLDNRNKNFLPNLAVAENRASDRWILTTWENTFRSWGNPDVPCLHTDPKFPDCAPGDTVRLEGKLLFYQGDNIKKFINQTAASLAKSG